MLFLFYLPILPMSGQAFYWSTIWVLFASIYGLLLTLTNVYWDEAPMLFVFGSEYTLTLVWPLVSSISEITMPKCMYILEIVTKNVD